jgi:hypothetical protein
MQIVNPKLNQAVLGMNLDSIDWSNKPNEITYALNANIQSFDGHQITYTNELSNQICTYFPKGIVPIGFIPILEQDRVIFFGITPESSFDEAKFHIGQISGYNTDCIQAVITEETCNCAAGYVRVAKINETVEPLVTKCCQFTEFAIESPCLNFSLEHPITGTYKITDCDTVIYWRDSLNGLRYLNLNKIPYDGVGKNTIDCNKLNVFPKFCRPEVSITDVRDSGSLLAGVYQVAIAYCNSLGEAYTEYFDVTNPISVFENFIVTDTNYKTSKSLLVQIDHPEVPFSHFKVAVIKTINEVESYELAGVYPISQTKVSYTGNKPNPTILSAEEIFAKRPVYENAGTVAKTSKILMWGDLEAKSTINLQPLGIELAREVPLLWQTDRLVATDAHDYSKPEQTAHKRGYMRDEVYPIGLVFEFTDGTESCVVHYPGRASRSSDVNMIIPEENPDVIAEDDECTTLEPQPRWKVYNTGTKIGKLPFVPTTVDECYEGPWEYGEMAYWESSETYPNDPVIWGTLAGQPIRHHKFPDSAITHIHDSFGTTSDRWNYNHTNFIFPIGITFDRDRFLDILQTAQYFDPKTGSYKYLKDIICGFKFVRGNRLNNKSVIARGLLYDVLKYTKEEEGNRAYYFPNYPYNDSGLDVQPTQSGLTIGQDPYLSRLLSVYDNADRGVYAPLSHIQNGGVFQNSVPYTDRALRYTFHSPDTHFQKPVLGTELKLETEEFGVCRGHFQQVEDHPKHKFLTQFDSYVSALVAFVSSIDAEVVNAGKLGGSITGVDTSSQMTFGIDQAKLMSTFSALMDIIEDLIPLENFAYQFTSVGNYNNYVAVPNDKHKRRLIDLARYLQPEVLHVDDDAPVNNFQRESSVYLKLTESFLRAGQTTPYSTPELTRYTLESHSGANIPMMNTSVGTECNKPAKVIETPLRSFYASIKRSIPDQYGTIFDVDYLFTGKKYSLIRNLQLGGIVLLYPEDDPSTIFGGDIFISKFGLKRKLPFFTQNLVGRPDTVDASYDLVPNVAYPMYYISSAPEIQKIQDIINGGTLGALFGIVAAKLVAFTLAAIPGAGTASNIAYSIVDVAQGALMASLQARLTAAFVSKNNLSCDRNPVQSFIDGFGLNDIGQLSNILGQLSGGTIYYQSGKFYLFSYGVPYFFAESDVNVDYRHGSNSTDHNFYPNVGRDIPDNWLQEKNVSIQHDNYYEYNATYSKQNIHNQYCTLPVDFDPTKVCSTTHKTRVIYSDVTDLEEQFDAWLLYRANNYYDFPKTSGKLISLNAVEQDRIFARFENNLFVYNDSVKLNSTSPVTIEIGTGDIFAQAPAEFSRSDIGYMGTQNKAFLSTPYGHFFVDARRGQVFQVKEGVQEISSNNAYNFFKNSLPFKILERFPTYNIDNAFKDVGISLAWDERFKRVILTKLDYECIDDRVVYDEDKKMFKVLVNPDPLNIRYEYTHVTDSRYFCNRSFTIGYSVLTKTWISFYSFLPNYYLSFHHHFASGKNEPNAIDIYNGYQNYYATLWNHGLSPLTHQRFYGDVKPYILEYSVNSTPNTARLTAVTINQDVLEYYNKYDFSRRGDINFNKAIIYNKNQTTGLLKLINNDESNLRFKAAYPKIVPDGIEVVYTVSKNQYSFNGFWDVTKNRDSGQPIFLSECTYKPYIDQYPIDKVLNNHYIDYSKTFYTKKAIEGTVCRVRLIQDIHSRYKFINNFEISNQHNIVR